MPTGPDPRELDQLRARLEQLMQQHQELFERLRHGQQHFRGLARSVWRVQEEERRRLARDLHDGIGQNLAALTHQLGAALQSLSPDAVTARSAIEQARALTQSTLDDTRALSRLLRPQILDDLGLEAALTWLARSMSSPDGPQFALVLPASMPKLDNDLATLIFRVAQEASNNIVRHSRARNGSIAIEVEPDRLRVRIHDDGRGCDLSDAFGAGSQGRSGGLGGMRERVRLFDGEIRIESAPGAGFSLLLELPVPTNPATLAQ